MSELHIDFSTLDLWRLCNQRMIYNSVRGFQGESTEAQNFGSLIHFATEILGKAGKINLPTLAELDHEIEYLSSKEGLPTPETTDNVMLRVLRFTALEAHEQKYPLVNLPSDNRRSLAHALTLLARYTHHYSNDSLTLVDYETKHEALLGNLADGTKVFYRGTIDGLLSDAILERKTTGYIDTYASKVNPNDQATGYLWLARDLYKNPSINRVFFDIISTDGYGKSKWSKTADPKRWTIYNDPQKLFLRTETTRTEDQIEDWKTRVLFDASRIWEDIARDKEKLPVTMKAPNACDAFFSPCPYKHLCQAPKAIRTVLEQNTVPSAEQWQGFSYKL